MSLTIQKPEYIIDEITFNNYTNNEKWEIHNRLQEEHLHLLQKYYRLNDTCNDLQVKIETLYVCNDNQLRDHRDLCSKIISLTKENEKLKEHINNLENNVFLQNIRLDEFIEEVATQKVTIRNLENEVVDLKHEVVDLKNEVVDLKNEVVTQKVIITNQANEIVDLKNEVATQKVTIGNLENEVTTQKVTIGNLENEVATQKVIITSQTNEIVNLTNRLNTRDIKELYSKYIIAFQDINQLDQLENRVPVLKQIRSNRMDQCHYIFDSDSQKEVNNRRTVLLNKIKNMPIGVEQLFNKRYPNFITDIIKYIAPYPVNVSIQDEEKINEWWED